VVDLRPATEFAERHLRGTLNIPLIRSFTTWAGWLLPYDRDIYLMTPDLADAATAQRALASIGLDAVRGVFTATSHDPALANRVSSFTRQSIHQAGVLAAGGYTIVDLRDPGEWAAGHLDEAVHHPLGKVTASLADLPRDTPLAIHCQAGTRSAIGASVLERMGFERIIDLSDGWNGLGAPTPVGAA